MYTSSIHPSQASEELKLKDRVLSFVREKLFTGQLAPGSRLSEIAIAKQVGISRTPVREAMMQLHAEGVVDQLPRYGWFVRMPDRAELIDLYEIRELLECHAAARAAETATVKQCDKLKSLLQEFRVSVQQLRDKPTLALNAEHLQRSMSLDLQFHESVLEIGGNNWVWRIAAQCRLITRLHLAKWRLSPVTEFTEGRSSPDPSHLKAEILLCNFRTLRQHHQIHRAIAHKDATLARQIMATHIRAGLARALAHLDKSFSAERTASELAAQLRAGAPSA